MSTHIEQSKHNVKFHTAICDKFPELFYDWKITVLFYTALHYIKAYYQSKSIDIGHTHYDIERNISPFIAGSPHKVNTSCWNNYKALFRYSQIARYDGVADATTFEQNLKANHQTCLKHIEEVKKYIIGKGINLS